MFGDDTIGRLDAPQRLATSAAVPAAPMFDVADYWRLAVKHRLVILGSIAAALVIGVIINLLTTPVYKAATTLQIDREAARVLNVDEVQPRESGSQGEEFFSTQYGLLRSRSLAERVIESLGLASSEAFLERMKVEPPAPVAGSASQSLTNRREAIIGTIQNNLTVTPVRGSRLVTVAFDSPDPQLAATIANAVAENFIQANLDRKYESSRYVREFLEERIAQTKANLEEAERELVAYAVSEQIINLSEAGADSGGTRSLAASNLETLNEALSRAQAERVASQEKWRQASGADPANLPEVLQNPTIQRLVEERARVGAEYQQKSTIYAPSWPELLQLKARLDELTREINAISGSVRSSIRGEYVVAANREQALRRQVDSLKGEFLDLRDRSVQYNILQRELDTSRTLYDGLLQRYKEVGITGGVTANNISVIDTAQVPAAPSEPRLIVNLVLSALLGLGLGAVVAFILEALDETLASPDDIESKLGLSTLGVIPLLDKGDSVMTALADTRSNFSESYYSLRTALQFSTPDGMPGSILVTSSRPAEGKSTTAYAIGLNTARLGRRVLLIDGDLRNPSMHRVVGVENDQGMSNLLSGGTSLQAVARPTSVANLDFIPSGPLPPNPAELWGGDRIKQLLADAGALYDHVIIDGPPVLGFADAPLLASSVEGTLFTLESRGTRRAQARGALRRLALGGTRILGAVMTKFNAKAVQYGGYDYNYDYDYGRGSDAGTGKGRKGKAR